MDRTPSVLSLSSSNSCNAVEDGDVVAVSANALETEEKVYVAVVKEFKQGKANLIWVLNNTPKTRKIVIVHVHVPEQLIPIMGARFPADQLKASEVKIYREIEKKKMEKALNKYIEKCSALKEVHAEKLVVEGDDAGQALVNLIAQHRITNLFMGAAMDKKYSKKMKEPESKKALIVHKQADPSCKIWFLCKGNLICKRGVGLDGSIRTQTATSARSSLSDTERHSSLPSRTSLAQLLNFYPSAANPGKNRTCTANPDYHEVLKMASMPYDPLNESSSSTGSRDEIVNDHWDGKSRGSRSSECSVFVAIDDESFATMLTSMHISEMNQQNQFLGHHQKVKSTKDLCTLEIKHWNEIEGIITSYRTQVEELRKDRDKMSEVLKRTHEQRVKLEEQLSKSKCLVNDLEKKLSDAHNLLFSLEREHVRIQKARDDTFREVAQLRQNLEKIAKNTNEADRSLAQERNLDAFLKTGKLDIELYIRELFVKRQ